MTDKNGDPVGNQIRHLRELAGLCTGELADRSHLAPSLLLDMEIHGMNLTVENLTAVAAALDVSLLALLEPHSLVARIAEDVVSRR